MHATIFTLTLAHFRIYLSIYLVSSTYLAPTIHYRHHLCTWEPLLYTFTFPNTCTCHFLHLPLCLPVSTCLFVSTYDSLNSLTPFLFHLRTKTAHLHLYISTCQLMSVSTCLPIWHYLLSCLRLRLVNSTDINICPKVSPTDPHCAHLYLLIPILPVFLPVLFTCHLTCLT